MALKIRISGVIGEGSSAPKGKDGVYPVNTSGGLQTVLDANPNEKDVFIDINSDGGSVYEGLAMYDILRTSGRNVHTNAVGGCHSIAVILLLAAPAQWRTANPNIRSLMHLVRTDPGQAVTGAELAQLAESTRREEDRIVQIYSERTSLTDPQARQLIQAEKTHTADDLLKMGFISKINQYKSNQFINQKNRAMATERKEGASLLERIGGFLMNAAKVLSPSNFNYEDAEGNTLFSTASETDDLAVGTAVSFPDDTTGGTFELPATEEKPARIVVIEDFVVTSIEDVTASDDAENLKAENESLRAQLAEAVNLIEEMKSQIGSGYQPQNRTVTKVTTATRTVKKAAEAQKTAEQIKNEVKENHAKGFGVRGIHAPRKQS